MVVATAKFKTYDQFSCVVNGSSVLLMLFLPSVVMPHSGYAVSSKRLIPAVRSAATGGISGRSGGGASDQLLAETESESMDGFEPDATSSIAIASPKPTASNDTKQSGAASGASDHFDTYEYHIAYSTTYHVPVLLFSAVGSDKSVLSVDQVIANVPHYLQRPEPEAIASDSKSGDESVTARMVLDASFITQSDHPTLGIPYYGVHPCKTAQFMHLINTHCTTPATATATATAAATASAPPPIRYLLCWLSVVGPIVGCHTPASLMAKALATTDSPPPTAPASAAVNGKG